METALLQQDQQTPAEQPEIVPMRVYTMDYHPMMLSGEDVLQIRNILSA